MDALLERYAAASGRDLAAIDFYRALATFELACITEGAHARLVKSGRTERIAATRKLVGELARISLEAASGLR